MIDTTEDDIHMGYTFAFPTEELFEEFVGADGRGKWQEFIDECSNIE